MVQSTIHTQSLKSLSPLASVWSKTTLNTGISYATFQQFPMKWSFGRNSQIKIAPFYYKKSGNFCLSVPPEAPFYLKLLKMDIDCAMVSRQNVLVFQA